MRKFWTEWTASEKGVVIGLILGLLLLGAAALFSKTSDAKFCPFSFGEDQSNAMCLRYISIYPLFFIILGWIVGWLVGIIYEKRGKTGRVVVVNKKETIKTQKVLPR